jgi:outer membrane protein OmpA-like peptidoglycan-associated protein
MQHVISCLYSVVLALCACAVSAQPQKQPLEFGLLGGIGLATHDAAFSKLGNFPSCCPEFTGGSGSGVVLGGYAAFVLTDRIRLHGRLVSSSEPTTMTDDERTVVADLRNGASVVDALFRHELNATIATVGIEPLIAWQPMRQLELLMGPRIAFTTTASFTQRETLEEPADYGAYLGDDRVWVDNSGLIPQSQSIRLGLVAAARYSLPMNGDSTLVLVPELSYVYDLSGIASGLAWDSHQIRLTAAIGWRPKYAYEPDIQPDPPANIIPETIPEPIAERPADRKPPLAGTITAVGLNDDGSEESLVEVRIEETVAKELRPLLPFVYFNEGDASIPTRYRRKTQAQAEVFREDQLFADSTLGIYHDILNIIGRRMIEQPAATLTITGTTSATPQDNGKNLAEQRAEAVRSYLVTVWGIQPTRLDVVARPGLPERPTRANDPLDIQRAHEENRRVEFTSADPDILRPVTTTDTIRIANPPSVRFRTDNTTRSPLSTWSVTADQGGRELFGTSGTADLPAMHVWKVAADRQKTPLTEEPLSYRLTLEDQSGGVFTTAPATIPVRQVTISRKKIERIGDKEIDRFSLILFDFDEAIVKGQNAAIVGIIASKTKAASSVTISGSTDVIGSETYNAQLARSRAVETAKALGLTGQATIISKGENGPYTMSLPEGRAYNRTVVVTVETPIAR